MRPIRTIVVDDEPLARKGVCRLLAAEPDIEIIAECADGEEAVAAVLRNRPDLMVLDIQMPNLDGFGVLRRLAGEFSPATIFLTAYDQHAVEAFDSAAIDYVLKPVNRDRFQRALARARSEIQARGPAPAPKKLDRLTVKTGDHLEFVRAAEIDWIEANDNYVLLHTGARSFLLLETMTRLESCLPDFLVRVHRSRIVNFHRVREIHPLPQGDYEFHLPGGAVVASGRHYRGRLQTLLRNFK